VRQPFLDAPDGCFWSVGSVEQYEYCSVAFLRRRLLPESDRDPFSVGGGHKDRAQ
jgi:hypothetical protein